MANCAICDNKASLNRFKLQDGWICSKCFKKCGFTLSTPIMSYSSSRIKDMLEQREGTAQELQSFNATKSIGAYIEFDENSKKIKILNNAKGESARFSLFDYADIIDCDIVEDAESVVNGGIARAVAGNMIGGSMGAYLGLKTTKKVINELTVKIVVNNLTEPNAYIRLIVMKTKTSSPVYQNAVKFANDIAAALSLIIRNNSQTNSSPVIVQEVPNAADEIRKFNTLLQDGLITQDEFDAKKKQLLGL